jgi:hypothetical protein
VIPLPKLRAEHLLKQAQELAEKKDRSKEENDKLAKHLQTVREQLQMAELLGYGKKIIIPCTIRLVRSRKSRQAARAVSGGLTQSNSNLPICSEKVPHVAG